MRCSLRSVISFSSQNHSVRLYQEDCGCFTRPEFDISGIWQCTDLVDWQISLVLWANFLECIPEWICKRAGQATIDNDFWTHGRHSQDSKQLHTQNQYNPKEGMEWVSPVNMRVEREVLDEHPRQYQQRPDHIDIRSHFAEECRSVIIFRRYKQCFFSIERNI